MNFMFLESKRMEKKMNRVQMSKQCGIPLTTLHDLEKGKVRDPKLSTVLKLSAALDMSIEEILAEATE